MSDDTQPGPPGPSQPPRKPASTNDSKGMEETGQPARPRTGSTPASKSSEAAGSPSTQPQPAPRATPRTPTAAPSSATHGSTTPRPATPRSATPGTATPGSTTSRAAGAAASNPASVSGSTAAKSATGTPSRSQERGSTKPKSAYVPDPRLAALQVDDEEIPLAQQVVASVRETLPAFLVSMTAHLVLLIALFLITLQPFGNTTLDLTMGFSEPTPEVADKEEVGVELEEPPPPPPPSESMEEPTEPATETSTVTEATVVEPEVTSDVSTPTVSVREALTGREGTSREALLTEFGGTTGTQDAVKEGLDWLARNQSRDGTWSLKGPFSDGTQLENRSAATAMALLCFLGAGHTHVSGDHQKTVSRGLDALLKRQSSNGDFYRIDGTQSEIPNHHLYTHAQGLIVMCEVAAMTGEERFLEAARKAIAFAEEAQSPEGGWRYVPKQESDLSVTGWFVIGLQSARMAGLDVKETTWEGIGRFLTRCHHEDGVRFIYKKGYEPTLAMTAEGLLCRQYVGWNRDEPALQDGVAYLTAHPVDWNEKDFYYWYYAAQVMHNMEGETWETWNSIMREVIPANQEQSGRDRGSWDPEGDRWAMTGGGRLYSTCLMLLTLEVYYRHLPLYRYRIQ